MATKKEQQELIEILKFTPCTYKISLWGYGGEKVMGTVDPKVWDYCMKNQVDLSDLAWNDEDTVRDEMGLDLEQLPYYPGQWYECDNLAHVNGVSRDSGTLLIEDEKGNTVIEKSLEEFVDDEADNPKWVCNDEVYVSSHKKGEVVFVGSSNEKGTFFEGEFEIRAPFNIEKLEFHYDEVDGEEIVNCVYYDGEEIENYGGSTDGKSSDMTMVRLIDNKGNWERYEPEEKDWGHPPIGPSPSDWESSPKIKFKKQKPSLVGWYDVNWNRGSTYGTLYWDGENFGDWEYGKFHPKDQDGIVTYSGYNWDTSDWSNQPDSPPEVVCKKCNWIGDREEMVEDDEYNYMCPNCESKENDLDWLDYDPNSKEGRANRKKYTNGWDKEEALKNVKPTPTREEINQRIEEFNAGRDPNAKWPF